MKSIQIIPLIFLTTLLVARSDDQATVDKGPVHSHRVFPTQGLSIDARGQVLYSRQVISVPAGLSLGSAAHLVTPHEENKACEAVLTNMRTNLDHMIRNATLANLDTLFQLSGKGKFSSEICTHLSELCEVDDGNQHPRQKRFAFSLGAMFGMGLSSVGYWMYNRLAGYDAKEHINALQNEQERLRNIIHKQTDDIKVMLTHEKEMWSYLLTLRSDLRTLEGKINCAFESGKIGMQYSTAIAVIPNQFHRAVNSALQGVLTPDLLSYSQAQKMITEVMPLKKSLYHLDTNLLFKLSHVIPISLDPETLTLYYLIQVPHLTLSSIGVLYEMTNFGVFRSPARYRYVLPQYVAKFNSGNSEELYMPVKSEMCHKAPGAWLCGQDGVDNSMVHDCLQGIFQQGSFTMCSSEVQKAAPGPHISVSPSVVFLHSDTLQAVTVNHTDQGSVSTLVSKTGDPGIVLDLAGFDELIVGPHHITGHRRKPVAKFITSTGIDSLDFVLNLSTPLLSESWKGADEIMTNLDQMITHAKDIEDQIYQVIRPSINSSSLLSFVSILIIILILGVLFGKWIICKYIARPKKEEISSDERNPGSEYLEMQELRGSRRLPRDLGVRS